MPDPRTAEERLRAVLDDYGVTDREERTLDGTVRAQELVSDLLRAALAAEPVPAPLDATCAVCGNVIVKDAHGGPHPSAGDHDPASHVARAYGTQLETGET